MVVILAAILVFLFWAEVNSAIRGIFPSWPLLLGVPVLCYAYSRHSRSIAGPCPPPLARDRLRTLLRASVVVPLGRRRFRLYLVCHGIPDRCFRFRGRTMPLCARCMGLVIGIGAGFLVPAMNLLGSVTAIGLASILIAPVLLDGVTQLAGLRESSNPLRLGTGVIGGVGIALAVQAIRFGLVGF